MPRRPPTVAGKERHVTMLRWLVLVILIAGAAVGGLILFGLLMARMGKGRLVECGECGAFINEDAVKCPKCNAVFEGDSARCSECDAWIPIGSQSCPECGVTFGGIDKDTRDYNEQMRDQYNSFVNGFRADASKDLGTGFSDEKFKVWWQGQPQYIGFETFRFWLRDLNLKAKVRSFSGTAKWVFVKRLRGRVNIEEWAPRPDGSHE